MRRSALLAIVLVVTCGCSLRRKPKQPVAPPPKPQVTAPAPEQPLSVPQTAVVLPPEQPVSPDAVPAQLPLPPPPEPQPEAPRPARRAPQGPPAPPPTQATKPETPVPQPAEERPRLQEIVPAQEQRQLADAINARKREIAPVLDQAAGRTLSSHERNLVDRVRSFLQLSDQAAAKGDWRQADALSERALVLARELRGGR
ncbi:MAG: hypothetical protein ACE15B_00885 [Bryobacteraceae bacterium]